MQFVVGLPFAEPSPLCADVQLAACCVQVEMESSPGVACSLNGAVKAVERGGQEFDSGSAGGSPCQRIAFPLGSQSSPEEG